MSQQLVQVGRQAGNVVALQHTGRMRREEP